MLGAVLFFAILWLADFPKPTIDDLFYCGAGLNLAGGGDLSNPLLIRQGFPSHYFFVYPPLQSYLLAGWLRVFGVSAASVLALHAAAFVVIACSAIVILRRNGAPAFLEWLAPLGVSAAFLSPGLRPEAFSVALVMAGFALYEISVGPRFMVTFLSFALIFLGGSAAPRMTPFTGMLAACLVLGFFLGPGADENLRTLRLAAVGTALVFAGLVFLVLIHFRLGEFLQTFRLHATRVTGVRLWQLKIFFRPITGVRQWPILAVAAALFVVCFRNPDTNLRRLGLAAGVGFPLGALLGALGHGSAWFASLIILVLGAPVLAGLSRTGRLALGGLFLAVFLVANTTTFVLMGGMLSGKVKFHDPPRADVLAIRSSSEHPALVDSAVARYTFDFRLPQGFIDWNYSAPFPGMNAVFDKINLPDLYLLGPGTVMYLESYGRLNLPVETWTPLGLRNWSSCRDPGQVFLVPATEIK